MTTELTWLGHGSWAIATGGYHVLLGPFLDDSPVAPVDRRRGRAGGLHRPTRREK